MNSAIISVAAAMAIGTGASGQYAARAWGSNSNGQCTIPPDLGPCTILAAGAYHSVAVRTDGTVRAWGLNGNGQCTVPSDLGTCAAVAAGYYHSVAVRTDGTVQAWGSNSNGQCTIPTDLGTCTEIAAGERHTVVLRADGAIRAWGSDNNGQCTIPLTLGPCTTIAAGAYHSVAVRTDGTVRAWGLNGNGQCTIPSDLGTCTAVAAGERHTVALRMDGTVRAWGYNYFGQCTVPSGLGACTAVAANWQHSVAIRTDGAVRAWGYNQFGQCNAPLGGTGAYAAVAAGGIHTLGVSLVGDCGVGDLDRNGKVNGTDVGILLAEWGTAGGMTGSDIDGDGTVGGSDLGAILGSWGQCAGVPAWAALVEFAPDPAVVTNATLRDAIIATGLAWRVRDEATQMEMLLVPPGTFQMGCIMGSNQYPWCDSGEQPVHQVTLTNAFYLGRYEVTQSQWVAHMGSNPSYFQGYTDSFYRPVEQVSWVAIQDYLSSTGMRLPTEAEWEYACRAGTQTPFYNGSTDDSTLGTLAWFIGNAGGQTRRVGGKAANALGFHDMLGNVWERVSDWYGSYTANAQTNPTGPTSSSIGHVVRGGSYSQDPFTAAGVRSSRRLGHNDPGSANTGFRVARTP